jgi:PAS domain S-box-containing protein
MTESDPALNTSGVTETRVHARRVLSLGPDLSESARMRAELRRLVDDLGFSAERSFDIQVAVSEAVANAIEHAHGAGQVRVEFLPRADRLEVTVGGSGDFRLPAQSDGREHRGLGLPLMAKFADHLALYSATDGGTLVSLTFYLPEAVRPTSPLPPAIAEALSETSLIRGVVDSLPDGFAVFDENWRYVYVNEANARQGRMPREEMLGRVLWELYPDLGESELGRLLREAAASTAPTSWLFHYEPFDTSFEYRTFPTEGGMAVFVRDATAEKRAQAEREALLGQLGQERDQLQAVFQSMTEGVVIADPNRNVLQMNVEALRLHGFSQLEEVQRNLRDWPEFELFDLEGRKVGTEEWPLSRATRGETFSAHEVQVHNRNTGERRIWSFGGAPVQDEAGGLLLTVLTIQDVTEAKRVQKLLAHQAELLERLHANIPVMLVTYDPALGRFALNDYAEKALGWTTADANDGDFLAKVYPDPVYRARVEEFMLSLEPGWREWNVSAKDGRSVPSDWANIRLADETSLGIGIDLTARKQAEAALKESEDNLRAFFNSPGVMRGIVEVVDETTILHVRDNQETAAFVGLPVEALQDTLSSELGEPAEVIRMWVGHYRESQRTGKPVTFDYRDPRGEAQGWLSATVTHLRTGSSGRPQFAYIVRDITEQRRAEEELRASRESARRRLEAILSPDTDSGRLELRDIIEPTVIQSLLNHFHSLVNIPLAVVDMKGEVLVGVGWQDICTKYHRVHPDTCRHCIESDTKLTTEVAAGEFVLYKCKNNMWDIATPIMVGGVHLGNVFSGQFFFEDEELDYEFFRAQAREYDFDEDGYLEALEAAPRLSRQKVETAVAFLVELATVLSRLGLNNVKLARAERETERLLAQTTSVAETLQEALVFLPGAVPGVRFGHAYRSATEAARLGGDFFDVFALPDGQVGLLVGDVSGKGVEAAHLASFTREAIRAYALHQRLPHKILRLANEALLHRHGNRHFVTVALVLLDPSTGKMKYSLAGHPPPMLVSAEGARTVDWRTSPPLGAFEDSRFSTGGGTLRRDATLVFYTDGITEARKNGDLLGERGLLELLRDLSPLTPEGVSEQVMAKIGEYGGGRLRDDAAVLAISLA